MDYKVKLVQQSPTVANLIPDYQYQFQDVSQTEESNNMYASLVDFIHTNEELAIADIIIKDEYAKGFKKALALTRLWMDSLYIEKESDNNVLQTSK